jgi:hypothetical protein
LVIVDLSHIELEISSWSDDKLIDEATNNINNYIDDVKIILKNELSKRNYADNYISEVQSKTKVNSVTKEVKKLTGIKGWLLFYQIILFLQAFIFMISTLTAKNIILMISNGVLLLLFVTMIISIFSKKKKALTIVKIGLIVIIVVNCLAILGLIFEKNYQSLIWMFFPFIYSIAWYFYFKESKRVKNTFV